MENEKIETETGSASCLQEVLEKNSVDSEIWDVDKYTIKQNTRGFSYDIYLTKKNGGVDIEGLISSIKSISKFCPERKPRFAKSLGEPCMAELNISDLHISKLCWEKEVGHNYDMKEAMTLFRKAIAFKIEMIKKFNIEKIVFPIGNDFYHTDNYENSTTAGTRQDTDSRFQKMFQNGVTLLVEAIQELSQIAPVQVIVVAGNHGRVAEEILGTVINAYFLKDKNVEVDDSFLPRKYMRYGNSLLGYLHGDGVRLPQLPMIMAAEAAEDWGKTKYRYIKMGHYHSQKIILDEISGVIVEIMPSLSGTDLWHKRKGYVCNVRSAVTHIYSKESGLINKIYFNL